MRYLVAMAALTTAGCAREAVRERDRRAEAPRWETSVLSQEDLRPRPDDVPPKEAEQVGRASGVEGIRSSIEGSFTAPGRRQTMYWAHSGRPGPGGRREGVLLVFQGGREVWRGSGDRPVRAADVDGDGVDEWIELSGECDYEACTTVARVSGVAGEAVGAWEAERDPCAQSGREARMLLLAASERGLAWREVKVECSAGP